VKTKTRQFYRSKDPTNSVKVLKEKRYKSKPKKQTAENTTMQWEKHKTQQVP